MRHTRLLPLGLVAAFSLTLAADEKGDRPATMDERHVAERQALVIELLVEANRLEALAERLEAPVLDVTAGAMFLQVRRLTNNKFLEIKDAPVEAKSDEKPEEGLALDVRADIAFRRARKRSAGSKLIDSLVKEAAAGLLLPTLWGRVPGPYRQIRTLPANGKHTYRFEFRGGQLAVVGFTAEGQPLKFHVKHYRLGQLGTIYERGGTWREMAKGRLPIDVVIENPHGRPVSYTVYTN